MKRTSQSFIIAVIIFTTVYFSPILNAQSSFIEDYYCIVGDYLNSSTLKKMIDRGVVKPYITNYGISKIYINENNYFENGRLNQFYFSKDEFKKYPLPERWEIETTRKKMLRKHPELLVRQKYYSVNQWAKNTDGSLEINARYNSDIEVKPSKQLLLEIILKGNTENCEHCEKDKKVRQVYKDFIGTEKDGFEKWLRKNLGTTIDAQYLKNNFLAINTKFPGKDCPDKGDHYISFDGSVILVLQNMKIKSVLLFKYMFNEEVFSFASNMDYTKFINTYKDYFTPDKRIATKANMLSENIMLEIDFSNGIRYAKVKLLEGKSIMTDADQFPSINDVIVYRPKSVGMGPWVDIEEKYHNIYLSSKMVEAFNKISNLGQHSYCFTLRNGMDAKTTENLKIAQRLNLFFVADIGVDSFSIEVSDPKNKNPTKLYQKVFLTKSNKSGEQYIFASFLNEYPLLRWVEVKVEIFKTQEKNKDYNVRLFVFKQNACLYSESYINLPKSVDSIMKKRGYAGPNVYTVKLNRHGEGNLYGIDIEKNWRYKIVVVTEPDVKNIGIDIDGLTTAGNNYVNSNRKDKEIVKDININDITISGNSVAERSKTCELYIRAWDIPGNRDFYNAKVYVFLNSAL